MKIIIPGNPIAKKRPRFARRGKFVKTYNAQETEEGKALQIIMAQTPPDPVDLPVAVKFIFFMKRPKGHYGTGRNAGSLKANAPTIHIKKNDLDNMVKFYSDILNGFAWKDDCQIFKIDALKIYDKKPRTEIYIEAIEGGHITKESNNGKHNGTWV